MLRIRGGGPSDDISSHSSYAPSMPPDDQDSHDASPVLHPHHQTIPRDPPDPTILRRHPRPHIPRTVPANTQCTVSSIGTQALRPNLDVGASLQDLLNGTDDGKTIPQDGQLPTFESPTAWQTQIIRIYFQNVNGLKIHEDGADILDSFFHMETIRADVFGFVEPNWTVTTPRSNPSFTRTNKKYGIIAN
jgi:hypothetical protein